MRWWFAPLLGNGKQMFPRSPRFDKAQMIRCAEFLVPRSQVKFGRLLRRWVEVGLISHPQKLSVRPDEFTWSFTQLTGWLTLVYNHLKCGVEDTKDLGTLPIFEWLYAGDRADVPLQQVKRVMNTIFEGYHMSDANAKKLALEFVHRYGGYVRRQREVRATVKMLQGDVFSLKNQELETLQDLISWLLDPQDDDQDDPHSLPRLLSRGVLAHRLGLEYLASAPDGIWEWARVVVNWGKAFKHKQRLAGHVDYPLKGEGSIRSTMHDAPINLLFCLGHGMLLLLEQQKAYDVSSFMQPEVWKQLDMTGIVRGCLRRSSLIRPDWVYCSYDVEILVARPEAADRWRIQHPIFESSELSLLPDLAVRNPEQFITQLFIPGLVMLL